MARKLNWLNDWVARYEKAIDPFVANELAKSGSFLAPFRQQIATSTGKNLSASEFKAECCQAIAWLTLTTQLCERDGLASLHRYKGIFSPFTSSLAKVAVEAEHVLDNSTHAIDAAGDLDPLLCFESYLSGKDSKQRLQRGVFYTPRVVARHIVRSVDRVLREKFRLSDGLADTATWHEVTDRLPNVALLPSVSPGDAFIRILDPAAGTGIFLIEAVKQIYETLQAKWKKQSLTNEEAVACWNDYVCDHLIPRLHAVELMPTPSVISQLAIANELAATGYEFASHQPLCFEIADTLSERNLDLTPLPLAGEGCGEGGYKTALSDASPLILTFSPEGRRDLKGKLAKQGGSKDETAWQQRPCTVVLGNPPFRGISSNSSSWIGQLLQGVAPNGQRVASYYHVDGQPLNERKLWLQDDYVKFMRFAQWQIEQAGAGVIGFVTNHGYLDNTTFRGMRHAMLETFDEVDVFDLHGNRKKRKSTATNNVDESLFEIEQGVAIGVFSRTNASATTTVQHRQLFGSRDQKLQKLADEELPLATEVAPAAPNYLFVPAVNKSYPEYEAALPLNEIMPVNSTAIVTARDSFVVDFDRSTLQDRMNDFRDLSIPDDEIRERYFTNSRSTKYAPGDTRGWKLHDARRRVHDLTNIEEFVRLCNYRPFDSRFIFWADWMIDWPRANVSQHMLAEDNLALIARRQMPPDGECDYFWITDTIALDGLIRSDNRGSESIFPLWLCSDETSPNANLSPAFIKSIEAKLNMSFELDKASSRDCITPREIMYYIYGLFHCPIYRERYAEYLRTDFPRVVLPNSPTVWDEFREIGAKLVRLHLNEGGVASQSVPANVAATLPAPLKLGPGFPKYANGKIHLADQGPSVMATDRVWNFHVGAHQVCRKWLRDRRTITPKDWQRYHAIVQAIDQSLKLMDQLDAIIDDAGGWEAVFCT